VVESEEEEEEVVESEEEVVESEEEEEEGVESEEEVVEAEEEEEEVVESEEEMVESEEEEEEVVESEEEEEEVVESEEEVVESEEEVVESEEEEEELFEAEEEVVESEEEEEELVEAEEKMIESKEEKEGIQPEKEVIHSEQEVIQSEQEVIQSEQEVIQSEQEVIQSEQEVIQSEQEVIQSERIEKQVEEPKEMIESEKIINIKDKIDSKLNTNCEQEVEGYEAENEFVIESNAEVFQESVRDMDSNTETLNGNNTGSIDESNNSILNRDDNNSSLNSESIVPEVKTTTIERVVETKKRKLKKVLNFDLVLNDKTPQVIRPQLNASDEENCLRRSKRTRVPRLDYWRGQRPIYQRDSTGLTERIVSINKGSSNLIDVPKRVYNKANKKLKRNRVVTDFSDDECDNKRSKNTLDLSLHIKHLKEVFKNNDKYKSEHKNAECIKSIEDLNWKKSERSDDVETAIISKNREKGEALGMLKLGPLAIKEKSKTGDYVTHLTVTYGALALQIENNHKVIVKTGTNFRIDKRTNYSLQNSRKDYAYISFTVLQD
jgi:hypothetical protein